MTEKIFSRGIWVKEPRKNAPDFVFGSISIKYDDFVSWGGEYVNEAGYINLDIKKPKDASKGMYCELNTYKPKEEGIPQPDPNDYKLSVDGVLF
jgi:hypothetical protein